MANKSVDEILEGLEGAFLIGHRYFIKTVTYHYIGTVQRISSIGAYHYVILEKVIGVGQAGSESDATVKIVTGKRKPEQYETFPVDHKIRIWIHAITEDQEVSSNVP